MWKRCNEGHNFRVFYRGKNLSYCYVAYFCYQKRHYSYYSFQTDIWVFPTAPSIARHACKGRICAQKLWRFGGFLSVEVWAIWFPGSAGECCKFKVQSGLCSGAVASLPSEGFALICHGLQLVLLNPFRSPAWFQLIWTFSFYLMAFQEPVYLTHHALESFFLLFIDNGGKFTYHFSFDCSNQNVL